MAKRLAIAANTQAGKQAGIEYLSCKSRFGIFTKDRSIQADAIL
jgi:hypothetical protein